MISMEFLFPGGATELKFSDLAPRPLFISLVISRFGFKGMIWLLITHVPGHCLPVSINNVIPVYKLWTSV